MESLNRFEASSSRKSSPNRWFAIASSIGTIAISVALALPGCDGGPAGGCAVNGKECAVACDGSLGCVECAGDGDCGAAKPFCVTGHCETCAQSSDCGAGQACFLRENTCEPACTSNASCTDDKAPLCNLDTGACVECVTPNDCPGGEPICDPFHGQCSHCASDGDCGAAAPICDLSDGECRECIVDGQCPDGGLCHDHHCKPVCHGDSDCGGASPFCAPSGECVECLAPADCPSVAPFCNAKNDCAQCIVAADCTNPALPFCFDSEQCVQCIDKEDCPTGMKCKDHVCAN